MVEDRKGPVAGVLTHHLCPAFDRDIDTSDRTLAGPRDLHLVARRERLAAVRGHQGDAPLHLLDVNEHGVEAGQAGESDRGPKALHSGDLWRPLKDATRRQDRAGRVGPGDRRRHICTVGTDRRGDKGDRASLGDCSDRFGDRDHGGRSHRRPDRCCGIDPPTRTRNGGQCIDPRGRVDEALLDLDGCEVRRHGAHEGGNPHHVGCRHGCATEGRIAAAEDRGEDGRARGRHIDADFAVVGKRRAVAVDLGGSDGQHDVLGVGRRVGRPGVVVGAVIAGCGHEEVVGGCGLIDHAGHRPARTAAAPGVVGDRGAVRDGICERRHRVGGVAAAGGRQELERHDPHSGRHTHHSDVVGHAGDRAGHVGAVVVVVVRVGIVVDEVPAVEVVDVAVAVVVDAVAGDLARVGPDVGLEVGMVEVDARVDDGHHHRRIAQGVRPCAGGIDAVGSREAPELVEPRVGRQVGHAHHGVRAGPLDHRGPAEQHEGGIEVAQGLDQVQPGTVE